VGGLLLLLLLKLKRLRLHRRLVGLSLRPRSLRSLE
jgi:hypothetical protein